MNPMQLTNVQTLLPPTGRLQQEVDSATGTLSTVAITSAVAMGVFCYAVLFYGNHRLFAHLEAIGKISSKPEDVGGTLGRIFPAIVLFPFVAAGIGYGTHEGTVALGDRYLMQPIRDLQALIGNWTGNAAEARPDHLRQLAAVACRRHLQALLPGLSVLQQIQLRQVTGPAKFDREIAPLAANTVSPYWKVILALPSDTASLRAYLLNEGVLLRFKWQPAYLDALARIVAERVQLTQENRDILLEFYQEVKGSSDGQEEFLRPAELADYDPRQEREDYVAIETGEGSLFMHPDLLPQSHVSRQVVSGQFHEADTGEMDLNFTPEQQSVFPQYMVYLHAESIDSTAGDELSSAHKLNMISLIDYMSPDKESVKQLRARLELWRKREQTETSVAEAYSRWQTAVREETEQLKELYLNALRERLKIRENVDALFQHIGGDELPQEILDLIRV